MMAGLRSNEASKRIILETQKLYHELLSKPLEERQLAKPSFKFIQEITKNLITETRTLRNVFNPSDFETENKTWDRRRKCEFIQRLIDFAANHKQPVVGCVADKLVAGLEPNKANELLQALAKIAQTRLDGRDGSVRRPRTFTKQSPSSVSPPIKREDHRDSATQRHRLSVTNDKSTSQKSPQKAIQKREVIPPARDGSANSKASIDHRGQANDLIDHSPRSIVRIIATDDTRSDPAAQTRDVSLTFRSSIDSPSHNLPRKQSEIKPAAKSVKPSQQETKVSESEINKNIQQLCTDLDHLCSDLADVSQMEAKLKRKLTQSIDY